MRNFMLILSIALLTAGCGVLKNNHNNSADSGMHEEYIDTGYGKIRKSTSTSAATTLKVPQGSGYTNIYDYLDGRVAGVTVRGRSIRIRGAKSMLGDSDPLFIVDGRQVDDIGYLSPDMVESITVLKDASSTALYGVRGANGVLVITTRSSNDQ